MLSLKLTLNKITALVRGVTCTYIEVPRSTNPSNMTFGCSLRPSNEETTAMLSTTACSAAYVAAALRCSAAYFVVNVQPCPLGAWNLKNVNWKLDVHPRLPYISHINHRDSL